MELSDILDTPSPLIRVNACMYEYMPHMHIFVTALSNIPLIMLCMFPHGLYSLLDYEINLSIYLYPTHFLKHGGMTVVARRKLPGTRFNQYITVINDE